MLLLQRECDVKASACIFMCMKLYAALMGVNNGFNDREPETCAIAFTACNERIKKIFLNRFGNPIAVILDGDAQGLRIGIGS